MDPNYPRPTQPPPTAPGGGGSSSSVASSSVGGGSWMNQNNPMGGTIGDAGGYAAAPPPPAAVPGGGMPYYPQQPQPGPPSSMYPPQGGASLGASGMMIMNNNNTNPPGAATMTPSYAAAPSNPTPMAAPAPGSYASRSAQAYATYNSGQPSVSVLSNNPYGQPQQQPPPQQQQQQPQQTAPMAGGYAARSAQAYASTATTPTMASPSRTAPASYGGGGGTIVTPPRQPGQPQPAPMASGGGYAARSAQAHAAAGATMVRGVAPPPATVVVPPPIASQQQQQQPTMVRPPAQQPPPPQQQHQQQPPYPPPQTTQARIPSSDQSIGASTIATAATTPGYGQPPPPQQQQPPQAQSVYGSTMSVPSAQPQQQQPPMSLSHGQPQLAHGMAATATPPAQAIQQRLLTDATRKVQEHAYYMRQAMDQNNLPTVLERAAYMAGELGVPPHSSAAAASASGAASAALPSLANTGISVKLTPKNYYELYMRALEDMPSFEDYLLGVASTQTAATTTGMDAAASAFGVPPPPPSLCYTMREIYDCVQYCPRVLSRLYLQISAGSALIRSGEVGPKWVLQDLIQAVKCEQNPIRGLFLRNYLLTVLRDKLPDDSSTATSSPVETAAQEQTDNGSTPNLLERGTVKDSYQFVMENFMEMNKLWVRLQHLPGDGNTKEIKKRRERERNDLRILVGTNLVRISQLEGVTSQIYGQAILPRVLDHIVTVGDPLSQAYLMDCLVQVFPDEYHIETLPILLNVCPRLRDKVNIRTILQGLMDRLANYLADEELLDESDTNQVKLTLARDSFGMFEECVQKVYNARGPKLTSKEVIRLQTALLQFSLKCYPGNMEQIARCMGACVAALQQANASYEAPTTPTAAPTTPAPMGPLDDVSVVELEKLLSIPLESLALRVLELNTYSQLIVFLPWANRRAVAQTMLQAVDKAGSPPKNLQEIHQLFCIIEPLTRSEMAARADPSPPPPPPQAPPPPPPTTETVPHSEPTARATELMAGLGVSVEPTPSSTEAPTTTPPTMMIPPKRILEFGDANFPQGPMTMEIEKECALVSKLVHLLNHENTDVVYEMLDMAREHFRRGGRLRASQTLVAVLFASLKLVRRIHGPTQPKDKENEQSFPDDKERTEVDAKATPSEDKDQTEKTEPPKDEGNDKEEKEEESKETKEEDGEDVKAAEPTEPQPVEEETKNEGVDDDTKQEGSPDEETAADNKTSQEETQPSSDEANKEEATLKAEEGPKEEEEAAKLVSARQVFVFIQETIVLLSKANAEVAVKLFLEAALTADNFAAGEESAIYAPVAFELLSQSFSAYEERMDGSNSNAQRRSVTSMIGALLTCKSLNESNYEGLITKTAQLSAKLVDKSDQCQMVAQCAHLFFPVSGRSSYSNPQKALECLQRSLKVADACTSTNASQVFLFVDLLEHYVFFLEHKNPSVSAAYVTGLAALVKEYLRNATDARAVSDARAQYLALLREIQRKKGLEPTAELFASVEVDTAGI